MDKEYLEPLTRTRRLETDKTFCLSAVPGVGGTTTPYEEDNEDLNG